MRYEATEMAAKMSYWLTKLEADGTFANIYRFAVMHNGCMKREQKHSIAQFSIADLSGVWFFLACFRLTRNALIFRRICTSFHPMDRFNHMERYGKVLFQVQTKAPQGLTDESIASRRYLL
jgi:hypothetical protein